ncbi:MAG TPA: ATP-binding cassette domain-containing protein, partial [Pseudobdellovibrionaceae bacterium]|nr:ATP-binding cassette domain-containing protein [Pseudobdellovibrionaceae bacterium]
MNLIQIQNAHKSFGTKILFQNASLAINEGEHIGVIGPNGAGKTTLLKALIGQMELESGEIVRSKSLRLAYLEQEAEWNT